MGQFRKKPVVIEAVRFIGFNMFMPIFTGDTPAWLMNALENGCIRTMPPGSLVVTTPEGPLTAKPLDWIIYGLEQEIYPCSPSVFDATYENAAAPEHRWIAEEIVTYRVEDATGATRIQGVTEARATTVAEKLADDLVAAPLKLERVIYMTRRRTEVVGTFGVGAPPPCP